ncbi:MAG: hypothetical protein ACFFD2_12565 [Promethearchaeota archaeon]
MGIIKKDKYPLIYHDVEDNYYNIEKNIIDNLTEIIFAFIEELEKELEI